MAGEIQIQSTTAWTVYAIMRSAVGTVVKVSDGSLVAYATANLDLYAITLTEQGTASGYYAGNVPASTPAGIYGVTAYRRVGGSRAEGDTVAGAQEEFEWDGTVVVSRYSRLASATAGRTVVVDANGLIDANTVKVGPSGSGTAQTALNIATNLDATVSSRASPTNITAGTITTVTNLTNAPGAGDLTATMKASVTTAATAATPAVTVSDKTGFSLSSAGVLAIWAALTSALTTTGSIGKRIVDFMTTLVYAAPTTPPTAAANAAAWQALTISNGKTYAQAMEFVTAMVGGGKTSGGTLINGTQVFVVRDTADSANLASITNDGIGNRSIVSW